MTEKKTIISFMPKYCPFCHKKLTKNHRTIFSKDGKYVCCYDKEEINC